MLIGGGPTGVEMAGAIAEISRQVLVRDFRQIDPREARVLLLEAGPRILHTFAEDLAAKAEASLRRLGAEVRTNCRVTAMDREAVWMGDERIEAATILWAAGVAASPLVESLGVPLDRAGRVIVEPDLSIPGRREVFVIGDASVFLHQTGSPLPGMCPVAIQQGRHVAESIRSDLGDRPREAFHYVEKGQLATIGRAAAVCDFHGAKFSGFLAWVIWLFVHIFSLIGFENRIIVVLRWAWSYLTFSRSARLITGSMETEEAASGGDREKIRIAPAPGITKYADLDGEAGVVPGANCGHPAAGAAHRGGISQLRGRREGPDPGDSLDSLVAGIRHRVRGVLGAQAAAPALPILCRRGGATCLVVLVWAGLLAWTLI